MLARALPSILLRMTIDKALEVARPSEIKKALEIQGFFVDTRHSIFGPVVQCPSSFFCAALAMVTISVVSRFVRMMMVALSSR